MTIGSLFSGIDGLALGLEWAGFGPTIWQVEQDLFCRAVLAKHWPHVDRSVTDVRAVTTSALPRPRWLCGGFPCQDVSGAGKGAGLAGERSGLWFVFRDIIAHFRPEGGIVENVASGKRRWLCRVRSDLHALGYRTRAVQISAANVGAPHLRERVFVLFLADTDRVRRLQQEGGEREQRGWSGDGCDGVGLADAYGEQLRLESWGGSGAGGAGAPEPGDDREVGEPTGSRCGRESGYAVAEQGGVGFSADAGGGEAESSLGGDAARLPRGLDGHRWPAPRGAQPYPWEPPRTVQGKQPNRRPRLKACGNSVMPQCAYLAGLVLRDWAAL